MSDAGDHGRGFPYRVNPGNKDGMFANSPALALFGGPPDRLSTASARRTVVTLPWSDGPLPGDPWLAHLLPRRDYNTRLLDRLATAPPPPGAAVALFLADPLLRLRPTLRRLRAQGVAGIAAFPGLSRFGGGFGDALAQAGLTPRMEAERLAEAREAGFMTLAAVWDGARWPDDMPSPDHVLAPAGTRLRPTGATRWAYPSGPAGRRPRDLMICAAAPQSP